MDLSDNKLVRKKRADSNKNEIYIIVTDDFSPNLQIGKICLQGNYEKIYYEVLQLE